MRNSELVSFGSMSPKRRTLQFYIARTHSDHFIVAKGKERINSSYNLEVNCPTLPKRTARWTTTAHGAISKLPRKLSHANPRR